VTPAVRAEILRLREEGDGSDSIAAATGVSRTSVCRVIYPRALENSRRTSRAAKQRRRGTCQVCGGPTKYAGKREAVAPVCQDCAQDFYREQQSQRELGRGPVIERILALTDGKTRLLDIVTIIAAERGRDVSAMYNQVQVQVQRHLGYGTLERVRRGVYRRTEKAPT